MFTRLKNSLARALGAGSFATTLDALLQLELQREYERLRAETKATMPGNPAGMGFKVYSQADEDGILEAIFSRLDIQKGTFVEIGCGSGLENNTHYLLLKGWRGVWVDADPANIASIRAVLPDSQQLRIVEKAVHRGSADEVLDSSLAQLLTPLDLLSVDIDGNDLEVTHALASAWKPRVIVVEYNAKFPPGVEASISYDEGHRWRGDDYHGASITAIATRMAPDYRTVSCNLAGTNAFLVRADLAVSFPAFPLEKLFQPARFHLTALRSGHRPSLSFLKHALKRER